MKVKDLKEIIDRIDIEEDGNVLLIDNRGAQVHAVDAEDNRNGHLVIYYNHLRVG